MKKISLLVLLFCFHTLGLVGLFHTGLFSALVFFYRGMVYILLTSVFLLLSFRLIRKYVSYTVSTQIACVCMFLSLQSMFFVLVPVTLDRSISIFILGEFERAGDAGISELQMEQSFTENYVKRKQALPKRFTEQLQTKSISKTSSGYVITPWGKRLVSFFSLIGSLYNLKK